MPKISVIVPIYKVEAYLDRCVESILGQSFENFELILVDDGSPDRCPVMCDDWAQRDDRIRVIHKKNSGLSDARNTGVAAAKGEYIFFVDSDDYIHRQALQVLYQAVSRLGIKIAVGNLVRTQGEPLTDNRIPQAELLTPEALYTRDSTIATMACGKLYHRSVVQPYPVGKIHEDEYVTYRILFAQEQIAWVEAPLYGYFFNCDGIMHQRWSPRRLDILEAMEQQIAFFEERGYKNLVYQRISEYIHNLCWQIESAGNQEDAQMRRKYTVFSREKLRQCIREYGKKGYVNVLDHLEGYQAAWPRRAAWFALKRWARTTAAGLISKRR